jgi:hypothetical protein
MNLAGSHLNLVFAWLWILGGFLTGMVLGLKFHNDNWLGGYGSFKRRMHRLAHISFFGLGAVNLFFYLTVKDTALGALGSWASFAFVLGGVTMPLCCWLMAGSKRFQSAFAIPVVSLISGAVLTIFEVAL